MQKKWIKTVLILLSVIIFWQIIFNVTSLSNLWFNLITSNYNHIIYSITSTINFPLGELLYLSLILFFIYIIYKCFKQKSLIVLIQLITCIYFIYNSLWGIVYYKETFIDKTEKIEIDKEKLKHIYCDHLEKAEYYRSLINKKQDENTKFNLKTKDYLNDFKQQEKLLKGENWIYNYNIINNPKVKFSNISNLMNYAGILGYYNPFTIESNINKYNTDLKMPFTISHELAHQMGFASENQANFIAYFIGIHSNYNEVKYATYYKTIFSLLGAITKYDSLFVLAQIESLPIGINTDRKSEIEYYSKYDGKTNDTFSVLNDQFLKANNQDGKVSYSRYVELIYYYQTQTK